MPKKKKKKKEFTPDDKMKFEIAGELGLMDKIMEQGWGGLTAKESGRIGGIMTVRKKAKIKEKEMEMEAKKKEEEQGQENLEG